MLKFIMQKIFVKIDVFDSPNLFLTGQMFFPYAHNPFGRITFLSNLLLTLPIKERTAIICERAFFFL